MSNARDAGAFDPAATGHHFADNVMHFARVLRAVGVPVGPDRVIDALRALEIAGLRKRDDFYWTLASLFLGRREQFELFDQAFHVFWRNPRLFLRRKAVKIHFWITLLH